MNNEYLLNADVIDIIFEKRNKAYGAYNLRKFYAGRMVKSLLLVFGAVLLLCAFRFLPGKEKIVTPPDIMPDIETKTYIEPKEKLPEPQKPKAPEVPAKKAATANFISTIKIVDSRKDSADKLQDISDLAISNITDLNGSRDSVKVKPADVPGPVVVAIPEPPAPVFDPSVPVAHAEVAPAYPGGMDALKKFLERNLNNPRDMEEGEMVSVKIRFVVGYDGRLQSFETVQDGGAEFNREVIRVLKKMPDWIPGKTQGKDVAVYYTIPVKFVPYN